jgi:hypothetical protein
MNKKEAESLIDALIEAAYDSGYYSGKGEDGQILHTQAMKLRNQLRVEVLYLLVNSRLEDPKPRCSLCRGSGIAPGPERYLDVEEFYEDE